MPASMSSSASREPDIDLGDLPGHYIRRLQQIAVAIFLQETEPHGLTPVQFAALQALAGAPGIDQRTLARTIGLDTSTTVGVIDRLEARGLLVRQSNPDDRRVRLLVLTEAGQELLREAVPAMLKAQSRILAPLSASERKEFMRMMRVLVVANNALSRAPSEP
jgi:MarR family transcriptional regulator, lower aerobic nicotinate degradation pathway regulator